LHLLSFIVYIISCVFYFILFYFVLCTVRARPLWALAISRRPDKCIDMNVHVLTCVYNKIFLWYTLPSRSSSHAYTHRF